MRKIYLLPILLLAVLTMHATEASSLSSNASDGIVAGHEYVDLGLPSGTLWATSNIGAEDPYESGLYFAWGETEPREIFNWSNYKFLEKEGIGENGTTVYTAANIGEDISGTQYDAARTQWGDAWRMPTQEECEELIAYCTTEFLTHPDTTGLHINGLNDHSLFLPISLCPGNGITTGALTGNYWLATISDKNANLAKSLYFANSNIQCINDPRCAGLTIRPVISRNDIQTSVNAIPEFGISIMHQGGYIYIDGATAVCKIIISDLSGRKISDSVMTGDCYPVSDLCKGLYIITVQSDTFTTKAMKILIK